MTNIPIEILCEIIRSIDSHAALVSLRETSSDFMRLVDDTYICGMKYILTQNPKFVYDLCLRKKQTANFIVCRFPFLLGCASDNRYDYFNKYCKEDLGLNLDDYVGDDELYLSGEYIYSICRDSDFLTQFYLDNLLGLASHNHTLMLEMMVQVRKEQRESEDADLGITINNHACCTII